MEKNTIIFNGVKTDTFIEKSSVKIIYLLGKKKLNYMDNPPVAAIVNGELTSLQHEIPENAVIDLVPLFSSAGKKVYRHTLSFLLSYASSIVHPDRTLLSGHSLGDGYYFSYRNNEKPDVEKLKKVMQEAIASDKPVDLITLSQRQAMEYVKKSRLEETAKLLESRNDGSYTFNQIDTCLSVYHEPMLPSLRYLEVWDLMEYGDGLLLRYPQSRRPEAIMDFVDQPLLFQVFQRTQEKSRILNLESLGALNLRQAEGKIRETILLSEALQEKRFSEAAQKIKERGNVDIVFIAGPTSSGKRTCGMKLGTELLLQGYDPIILSLDDYRAEVGETMASLDVEALRKDVKDLLEGKEVTRSSIGMQKKTRTVFKEMKMQMKASSILIVEGVQTLNTNLIPDLDETRIFRIFTSALTKLRLDTMSTISSTDNRLLRRLVKECAIHGLSPVQVLKAWPSIQEEEKSQLFPFQNNADVMINTALEYEIGVLYSYALPLLRSVKIEDGEAYTLARRLISFLELVYPIPAGMVPADSLLREFIGGSSYDLI